MKKSEIVKLHAVLFGISDQFKDEKIPKQFAYFLAFNKSKTEPIIKVLSSARPNIDKKYTEFETKKKELINKFAKKDKDNNVITFGKEPNISFIIENVSEFNTQLETLTKDYQEVISKTNTEFKEFDNFLDQELEEDVNLIKIKLSDIPEKINEDSMSGILSLITE